MTFCGTFWSFNDPKWPFAVTFDHFMTPNDLSWSLLTIEWPQMTFLATFDHLMTSNYTQMKAQKLKTLLRLSRPNANGKNQNTNRTFKKPLQNSPPKLILEIWSSAIMVSFTVPSRVIQLQKFHGSKINFQFYQKLDQNIDHAINMVWFNLKFLEQRIVFIIFSDLFPQNCHFFHINHSNIVDISSALITLSLSIRKLNSQY